MCQSIELSVSIWLFPFWFSFTYRDRKGWCDEERNLIVKCRELASFCFFFWSSLLGRLTELSEMLLTSAAQNAKKASRNIKTNGSSRKAVRSTSPRILVLRLASFGLTMTTAIASVPKTMNPIARVAQPKLEASSAALQ